MCANSDARKTQKTDVAVDGARAGVTFAHDHDMFAVTARPQLAARAVVKTPRAHRRASVAARAENDVSRAVEEANAEWKDADATPAPAAMRVDAIDPADGSIAEAAPLGNDNSMLDSVMLAFKDSRAVETINGRAAMIGWTAALYVELTSNTSFMHQLFNERTFTLADGVTRTSTYPAAGFFLVPACVLLTLASSLAPALKKSSPNGLDETPEAFGPFRPEAEMTNGRGAMIGLVALPLVEKIMGGSALF